MLQTKLQGERSNDNLSELKTYRKPAVKVDQTLNSLQKPTFGVVSKSDFKDFFKNSKKASERKSFEFRVEEDEDVLHFYSLVSKENLIMKNYIPNQDVHNLDTKALYAGLWVYICKLDAEERLDRENSWSRDLFHAEPGKNDWMGNGNDSSSEEITDYDKHSLAAKLVKCNQFMPESLSPVKITSSIPLLESKLCSIDDASSIFNFSDRTESENEVARNHSEQTKDKSPTDLIVITTDEEDEDTTRCHFLESAKQSSCSKISIRSISDRKRKTPKPIRKNIRDIVGSSDMSPEIEYEKFATDCSPLKNPMFDSAPCSFSVNTCTLLKDLEPFDKVIADELGFSDNSETDMIKDGESSVNQQIYHPDTIVIHSSSSEDEIEEVFSEDMRKNSQIDSESSLSSDDNIINLNKIKEKGGDLDKFGLYLNQFEPQEKRKRRKTSTDNSKLLERKPKKKKKYPASKWKKKFFPKKQKSE